MYWGPTVLAAAGIAGSPLVWNIIARNEYRNKTMTRIFGGKYPGCYALAAWIFLSSLGKDYLYSLAVQANAADVITNDAAIVSRMALAGKACLAVGGTLVCSSFYRLGITGTYLGDYFGIYMSERVTGFPFSHFENPMYLGSTLNFLGIALQSNSVVGLGLTAWVWGVYEVATRYFENPFTDMIYRNKAEEEAKAKAQ